MNNVLDVINSRKSVRNYSPDKINPDDLKTIAECAVWAPNAMNEQKWHFTVVTDPDMLNKMNNACRTAFAQCPVPMFNEKAADPNFNAFFNAPAVIVVSSEEDKFTLFDAGAAAQTICIAAKSLGYGTCVTASTGFMFDGDPGLKADLQIPENQSFVCAITIGKEKEGPDSHVRDRKTEVISYI